MKAHELRDLSIAELKARLNDEKTTLQKLAFSKSVTGQVENPARLKEIRKEIARLHTVITQKKCLIITRKKNGRTSANDCRKSTTP